jgi:hypothetical protein
MISSIDQGTIALYLPRKEDQPNSSIRNLERIWFASGEPVPDRERDMIQSPQLMITVAWKPRGFHVVTALPKGPKSNAGDYTTEILQRIKDWRENQEMGWFED